MTVFFERGLGLPAHDFLHGILHHYGAQLNHLTPNGVLHITCFIMLYEAYLGIYLHWGLWKRLFLVKSHTSETIGRLQVCGGVGIQVKPGAGYFDLQLPDTVKRW